MVDEQLIEVDEQRIGLFGGTFDPPHNGHLALAAEVRYALGLHRMVLMVANDPWQKTMHGAITAAHHRFNMVSAVVEAFNRHTGSVSIEASDHEIQRGGKSFTSDTLRDFAQSGAKLFLVVGSDIAANLDTWKSGAEIRRLATLVVARRGAKSSGRPPKGWDYVAVDVPALDISASDIRERFRSGRPVSALVPPQVLEYVRAHGLYGCAE